MTGADLLPALVAQGEVAVATDLCLELGCGLPTGPAPPFNAYPSSRRSAGGTAEQLPLWMCSGSASGGHRVAASYTVMRYRLLGRGSATRHSSWTSHRSWSATSPAYQ